MQDRTQSVRFRRGLFRVPSDVRFGSVILLIGRRVPLSFFVVALKSAPSARELEPRNFHYSALGRSAIRSRYGPAGLIVSDRNWGAAILFSLMEDPGHARADRQYSISDLRSIFVKIFG